MIKIAMLSFWHVHAKDYARQVSEHPDTEIVAVWDEIPERGIKEATERDVPFYASLDELLARPDIDAVVVDTPTSMHHDVMVKAALAGKHIFTEKVIAPTLRECNAILAAVKDTGVKLTVSLPRLYESYTIAIRDILNQGLLGELTLVRTRLSHSGAIANWLPSHFYNKEQCGGGALIDLGCHPMYLARLFLGLPESVSAHYGYMTDKDVEDNAVAVLKYANGAIGIVEAGFVNSHSPFRIEIHGTEGTITFDSSDNQMMLRTNKQEEYTKQWTAIPLSAPQPRALWQWVSHIQQNTTADENIRLAVDLTKLMEAANLSSDLNKTVFIDELSE